MIETKRAGSVAAEDRPERVLKACESLILRPPESTRQEENAAPSMPDRLGSSQPCTPMHLHSTCIPREVACHGTT